MYMSMKLLQQQSLRKNRTKRSAAKRIRIIKGQSMDDPTIIKTTHMEDLRDQWLINRNKTTPTCNAKIKKMKVERDKKKAKVQPKHNQKCETSQINNTKTLAFGNSQIESFKHGLSNSLIRLSSDPIQLLTLI